jgi:type I restriction enzyme M protein
LEISEDTFRRIVKELERFDLSKTGDDIKGLAFERFLGNTFRGELGQFFTPRPLVDFMVNLLDPREGESICDPAAGSGGFLIRAFEHVRDQIGAAVQAEKDKARAEIEAKGRTRTKRSRKSTKRSPASTMSYYRLTRTISPSKPVLEGSLGSASSAATLNRVLRVPRR